MAHLWIPNTEGNWDAFFLDRSSVSLDELPPLHLALEAHAGPQSVILWALRATEDEWALVAGARRRVFVNGFALRCGLHMLADKDEIRLDPVADLSKSRPSSSRIFFFSTERLAREEPFPGTERAFFCPRCKTEIKTGMPAVRCPSCRIWHHEIPEEKNCWSYSHECAACNHPTNRTELSWAPDGAQER